jgi:isopenicillin-N epimerase
MFREVEEHLARSRKSLGDYLGADADNLVFVLNATVGMNIVVRSLQLNAGDEILTTNHEYGAVNRLLRFTSRKSGAVVKIVALPLPLTTEESFVEAVWSGVTGRTRIIALSHITAPTALVFPLAEICRRARERGILTLIDGAHVPGHIDLNLVELGADFYTGNGHKWLCAPRGAAFLYARPEVQDLLEPLIVSWGYESPKPSGSTFQDLFGWVGTLDPSPYLAVEAAVAFQRKYVGADVRSVGHSLVLEAQQELQAMFGQTVLSEPAEPWVARMAAVVLPRRVDKDDLLRQLWQDHNIEVIIREWAGHKVLRVSVQVYNDSADIDQLIDALKKLTIH